MLGFSSRFFSAGQTLCLLIIVHNMNIECLTGDQKVAGSIPVLGSETFF